MSLEKWTRKTFINDTLSSENYACKNAYKGKIIHSNDINIKNQFVKNLQLFNTYCIYVCHIMPHVNITHIYICMHVYICIGLH